MTLTIDSNVALRLLELSDAIDVFNTIDNQRGYLEKWLPIITFNQERKDMESVLNKVPITISKCYWKKSDFYASAGFEPEIQVFR